MPGKEQVSKEDRDPAMEETGTALLTKPTGGFGGSAFEIPKFGSFEMPKIEVPAAFRDFAEKGLSQARERCEKANDLVEKAYASACKGASEYGFKVIEAARVNTNAAFDFATELMGVKSLSEFVELSTMHARRQFEVLTAQAKALAEVPRKVAIDTTEPAKEGVSKAIKKVA